MQTSIYLADRQQQWEQGLARIQVGSARGQLLSQEDVARKGSPVWVGMVSAEPREPADLPAGLLLELSSGGRARGLASVEPSGGKLDKAEPRARMPVGHHRNLVVIGQPDDHGEGRRSQDRKRHFCPARDSPTFLDDPEAAVRVDDLARSSLPTLHRARNGVTHIMTREAEIPSSVNGSGVMFRSATKGLGTLDPRPWVRSVVPGVVPSGGTRTRCEIRRRRRGWHAAE